MSNELNQYQNFNHPKIAILGTGAIGQLLFHQLKQQNISVLMLRPFSENELPKQLTLTNLHNLQIKQNVLFDASNRQSSNFEHLKFVIVCVKAYQVMPALKQLVDKLPNTCHLLLLNNGMGPHLKVKQLVKNHNLHLGISLGTISQGAYRKDKWHVQQTGAGITQLGHFYGDELTASLKTLLLNAIPNCYWSLDIIKALWEKLAVNAAINPLTAIYQCRNGTLEQSLYQEDIQQITEELVTVALADHVSLEKDILLENIYQVIKLTAENYSSMYQDIHHKRYTEINAINGYLLERAKFHKIPLPKNMEIVNKIKMLSLKN